MDHGLGNLDAAGRLAELVVDHGAFARRLHAMAGAEHEIARDRNPAARALAAARAVEHEYDVARDRLVGWRGVADEGCGRRGEHKE